MFKAFQPTAKKLVLYTINKSSFSTATSAAVAATDLQEPIRQSYVVYLYIDYRKETGTRVLRTYLDLQKAIEFAESISTKYKPPPAEEEEEDVYTDEGPRYVALTGTESDEQLQIPTSGLIEFGLDEDDERRLWYTRVAIDEARLFE